MTQEYYLIQAFEKGIKDVVWVSDKSSIKKLINKKYIRKKLRKPYLDTFYESYWFFKNKSLKEEFINSGLYESIKSGNIKDCHEEVGRFLGFPPDCCKHFKKGYETLHINYCGMYFASYSNTIKNDFKWLLDNTPLLNGEVIQIEGEIITIGESNWKLKLEETVNRYT